MASQNDDHFIQGYLYVNIFLFSSVKDRNNLFKYNLL